MAVPYTFAGATSSIPLSQLDTNFASTITLGNTAIQLGNTVTTLNNMTLANVTISSGNVTITNVTVTTANVTVGNITTLTGTSATYTNITSGNVTITGGTLNNVAIGGTTAASGAFTTLSGNGAFSLTGDQVQISEGGTGQTTANAAFNALAPSQTSNSGKYLKTDGANTSWDAIDINTADITGTLPILNGGTGQTTANAAFNALAPSQTSQSGKYLKTDGTNASWDALDISTADITGTLPIANGGTGLTALGTGVQTALGQNVTGSGGIVLATSPVLTTPNLGTPSAATLTNATGLPISTGVSGLGTGVATALGVAVGSAGAFVVNGGALGTPSSGTVTNLTGTASININGTVGATTPTTGAFTTLSASGNITVSGGTANGVAYLNGSKVLTTGSALTFDGTNLGLSNSAAATVVKIDGSGRYKQFETYSSGTRQFYIGWDNTSQVANITNDNNYPILFSITGSEQMRLTSTGLGIGTSSPAFKLSVQGNAIIAGSNPYLAFGASASSGSTPTYIERNGTTGLQTFYNNGTGTNGAMAFVIGAGSEGMRLDSSGNLGIGTSSPLARLDVVSASQNLSRVRSSGANEAVFLFQNSNTGTSAGDGLYLGIVAAMDAYLWNYENNPIIFGTNNAERARITSGGDLLVGTTNAAQGAGNGNKLISNGAVWVVNAATGDGFSYYNSSAAAYRFYVSAAGTISATNTTISAISDQRFKENIVDLDVGLDAVMALKPRKFDWKAGKGKDIKGDRGFIAQEFEQVFPDLIDEWKDPAPEGEEPYKSVRQDLIPVLVKAIQELKAELDTVKAELATLKGN